MSSKGVCRRGEGWPLEVIKNDETNSAEVEIEVETSGPARKEAQFYEPFAIIAYRIIDLFTEHYGSFVRRKIKFFGFGSSCINGQPFYDNGKPVAGTRFKRKLDGLAFVAEDLKGGDCFEQHEEQKKKTTSSSIFTSSANVTSSGNATSSSNVTSPNSMRPKTASQHADTVQGQAASEPHVVAFAAETPPPDALEC
ncbi:hypothetical protein FRB97_002940 [Tulasnella sp. 331]|nr:hypothetical protein FRB97_002940 [Tulasnella sp. 331]